MRKFQYCKLPQCRIHSAIRPAGKHLHRKWKIQPVRRTNLLIFRRFRMVCQAESALTIGWRFFFLACCFLGSNWRFRCNHLPAGLSDGVFQRQGPHGWTSGLAKVRQLFASCKSPETKADPSDGNTHLSKNHISLDALESKVWNSKKTSLLCWNLKQEKVWKFQGTSTAKGVWIGWAPTRSAQPVPKWECCSPVWSTLCIVMNSIVW